MYDQCALSTHQKYAMMVGDDDNGDVGHTKNAIYGQRVKYSRAPKEMINQDMITKIQ